MSYFLSRLLVICLAVMPALLLAQQQVADGRQPVATDVAANQVMPKDEADKLLPGQTLPLNTLAGLGADYRLGPNDLIDIEVFGVPDLKRTVRLNSSGMASLALVGNMVLAGFTAQQAEAAIAAKYAEKFLQDPHVSVFIKEFTTQRITILGAVSKPGIYPVTGQLTLLRALALAGGRGSYANVNQINLFRSVNQQPQQKMTFDLDKIGNGEMADPDILADDVIVVSRDPARTAMRDSLFSDILTMLNPFSYLGGH